MINVINIRLSEHIVQIDFKVDLKVPTSLFNILINNPELLFT